MTSKKKRMIDMAGIDNIKNNADKAVKPGKNKPLGRPKVNPYLSEKMLTVRMPKDIHKRLKIVAVYENRPMTEIVVDAIIKELDKLER